MEKNAEKIVSDEEVDSCCEKSKDFDFLMMQIKEKLKLTLRNEKIKLLIMAPSSWTIAKTQRFFDVSQSMWFVKMMN